MAVLFRLACFTLLAMAGLLPTSVHASHNSLLEHVNVRIECKDCSEEAKSLVEAAARNVRRGNPEFNVEIGWLGPSNEREDETSLYTVSISEDGGTLRIEGKVSPESDDEEAPFRNSEDDYSLRDLREFIELQFGVFNYTQEPVQPVQPVYPALRTEDSILASHINLLIYSLWINKVPIRLNPRQSGSYFGKTVHEIHQTTMCDLRYDTFWKYIFVGHDLTYKNPLIENCSKDIVNALQFAGYNSLKYGTLVHGEPSTVDIWNYIGVIPAAIVLGFDVNIEYLRYPIKHFEGIPEEKQENCESIVKREVVYLLQEKIFSEDGIKVNDKQGKKESRQYVRGECKLDLGEDRHIPHHDMVSEMMLVEAGYTSLHLDDSGLSESRVRGKVHQIESLILEYIDIYNKFGKAIFDSFYGYSYVYVLGAHGLAFQKYSEKVGIEDPQMADALEKLSHWANFCAQDVCAGLKAAADRALINLNRTP